MFSARRIGKDDAYLRTRTAPAQQRANVLRSSAAYRLRLPFPSTAQASPHVPLLSPLAAPCLLHIALLAALIRRHSLLPSCLLPLCRCMVSCCLSLCRLCRLCLLRLPFPAHSPPTSLVCMPRFVVVIVVQCNPLVPHVNKICCMNCRIYFEVVGVIVGTPER